MIWLCGWPRGRRRSGTFRGCSITGGSTRIRRLSHAAAKPYTQAAGLQALSEAVARRDAQAVVTAGAFPNTYRVRWSVPANLQASLIICSRNAKLLKRCLEAVAKHTAHAHREIVVVQHRTGDIAAMDRLLDNLRLRARAVYRAIQFRGHE